MDNSKEFAVHVAALYAEAARHSVSLAGVAMSNNSRINIREDTAAGAVGQVAIVQEFVEYIGILLPSGQFFELPFDSSVRLNVMTLAWQLGQQWKEEPPPPVLQIVPEDPTSPLALPKALIGVEIQAHAGFYTLTDLTRLPVGADLIEGGARYHIEDPEWAQSGFRPGREVVARKVA